MIVHIRKLGYRKLLKVTWLVIWESQDSNSGLLTQASTILSTMQYEEGGRKIIMSPLGIQLDQSDVSMYNLQMTTTPKLVGL